MPAMLQCVDQLRRHKKRKSRRDDTEADTGPARPSRAGELPAPLGLQLHGCCGRCRGLGLASGPFEPNRGLGTRRVSGGLGRRFHFLPHPCHESRLVGPGGERKACDQRLPWQTGRARELFWCVCSSRCLLSSLCAFSFFSRVGTQRGSEFEK